MIIKILSTYIDEINIINIIIEYKNSHLNYIKKLYLNTKKYPENILYTKKYINFLKEEEDYNFLLKNSRYVNWYIFIKNCKIDENNFNLIFNKLIETNSITYLYAFRKIPIELIESKVKYYTHKEWYYIGLFQELTNDFIKKYKNNLNEYLLKNKYKIKSEYT